MKETKSKADTADAEALRVIGRLPDEVGISSEAVSAAIREKLESSSRRDHLTAIKFNKGNAVRTDGEGWQFLASASVKPDGGASSGIPPMRARILNVVVTIENGDVYVELPFYRDS